MCCSGFFVRIVPIKIGFKKNTPLLVAAIILVVGTLLVALDYWADESSPFQALKWLAYDWEVRLALRYPKPCATNIAVVFIDEPTLELLRENTLGYEVGSIRFPFPRHVYGRMIRELSAEGARAIGIDILLGETWRDTPPLFRRSEALASGFRESELPKGYIVDDVDHPGRKINKVPIESDEFFAVQMRQASNIVLAAELTEAVVPPALFRTNAAAVGDITAEKDADGKLRRLHAFRDHRIWHLEIQRRMTDQGYRLDRVKVDRRQLIFTRDNGTNFVLHLDANGRCDLADLPGAQTSRGAPGRVLPISVVRFWHMGIVLGARELGLDLATAHYDQKRHRITLSGPNGVTRVIPVNEDGQFLVDWSLTWDDPALLRINCGAVLSLDALRHSEQPEDHLEYLKLLKQEGTVWQGTYPFRNKLVVVGSKIVGSNVRDMGPTPLSRQTFFVSTHWNVANSVITGRFIQPGSWLLEWLMVACFSLLTAKITWASRSVVTVLWVLGVTALVGASAVFSYVQFRFVLPLVLPVLCGLILPYVTMVTYRAVAEQQEKRRVRSVFAKMVAPEVVNELLGFEQLPLGGARRRITVFFSDVRGFTEMTDVIQARAEEHVRQYHLQDAQAEDYFNEQAREVLSTVNLYLSTVADHVKKHHGTLDKYMGDCVMAFWGAPTPNTHHALDCVRAAIESQRAIAELNGQREAENQARRQTNIDRAKSGLLPLPMLSVLSLGSGINTGMVTVGLMGSDAHFLNYTVFGREVNLASRLEGVSGRGRIIISDSTFAELRRDDPVLAAQCVPQPAVRPKGFQGEIKIYEVPWQPDTMQSRTSAP